MILEVFNIKEKAAGRDNELYVYVLQLVTCIAVFVLLLVFIYYNLFFLILYRLNKTNIPIFCSFPSIK